MTQERSGFEKAVCVNLSKVYENREPSSGLRRRMKNGDRAVEAKESGRPNEMGGWARVGLGVGWQREACTR